VNDGMTIQQVFEHHQVPQDQWERLCVVISSLEYAERQVGGPISGGVSFESLQIWHRFADLKEGLRSVPVTLDELRVLERCELADDDDGTWRGIGGRETPEQRARPFGLKA
jgi:hypothetical protein